MVDPRHIPVLRPKLIAVSVAACFALSSAQLLANPTGPTVVSGSAAFGTAGNTLSVTNSANAIINWQGFSIGINEITKFIQPSQLSAVLNRVVGNGGVNPQIQKSLIDGILSSNGHVYLLNPMGVVIGATARIDVAGFVASSLNLTDKDFQDGRLRFTDVPGAGDVVNHGIITTASGGRVFLVAPTVENTGIITSPQGDIVLAAGRNVELVSEGSPFVTVSLTASSEQALNVGSLIADAGRIGVYGALVRNSGVAEANGVMAGEGGQIRFVATKDLTIDAGSRISANGSAGGKVLLQAEGGTNLIAGSVEATGSSGRGGEVQALGVRVGLIGNGVIDASGETGGGSVMVGGDFQGANPNVQNAQRALIGPDGVIRADARTTGDGGRVIVWADGDTRFYGSISARGGAQGGDGGFVEVSGKQHLAFHGQVDTRAPRGRMGTLLLDPNDVEIHNGTNDGHDDDLSNASFNGFAGGGNPYGASIIYESELEGTAQFATVNVSASNSIKIKPLTTDGVLNLAYGGSFSAGSGGIVMEDTSNTIQTSGRSLGFSSGGVVTLGHLNTEGGFVSSFDTQVYISAGAAVSVASITTGNTSAYYSYVSINGSGPVSTGNIKTGNSGGDSSVSIYSGLPGGNISTGSITTGNAEWNTRVTLSTDNGSVTTGNITTGTAGDDGGEGSTEVYISANNGGVTTGSIVTGSASGETEVSIYSGDGGGPIVTGSITTGNSGSDSRVDISTDGGNISTGPITTGNAGDDSYVDLSAGNGSVTTGNIITGIASSDSDVEIFAGGNIVTGSVTTGASGDDSRVVMETVGGSINVTGPIITGNANDGSEVDLLAPNGGVTTGSITTGNSFDNSNSVFIVSGPGDIVTGAITTRGGAQGVHGGDVHLATETGRIFVNGDIDTRGADGGGGIFYGGNGGNVSLFRNSLVTPPAGGIAVQVGGSIRTGGGNGVSGALGDNASGGHGGSVTIGAEGGELLGSISVAGEINTRGGNAGSGGMAFYGGAFLEGGQGGQVTIRGSSVTTGLIDTRGGTGGDLNGGIGFYGGSSFSSGGGGGSLFISATGSILTGPINTSGGPAGNNITGSDDNWFASGGHGGSVVVEGSSITTGTIITRGANGGNNFGGSANKSGGEGGEGGFVGLFASGDVIVGPPAILFETLLVIDTSGGNGGAGAPAASPAGDGGHGGRAGDVAIEGKKIVFNGFIDAIGGAGGPSGPGAPAGVGGDGGDGGKVFLNALLDEGSPAVFETPVNALPGTLAAITGIVFVNAIEKAPFDINRAVHVGGGLAGPGGTAGKPGMIDFGGNVTFITLIPPVSDTDATTEAIDKILKIIQFGSCKAT